MSPYTYPSLEDRISTLTGHVGRAIYLRAAEPCLSRRYSLRSPQEQMLGEFIEIFADLTSTLSLCCPLRSSSLLQHAIGEATLLLDSAAGTLASHLPLNSNARTRDKVQMFLDAAYESPYNLEVQMEAMQNSRTKLEIAAQRAINSSTSENVSPSRRERSGSTRRREQQLQTEYYLPPSSSQEQQWQTQQLGYPQSQYSSSYQLQQQQQQPYYTLSPSPSQQQYSLPRAPTPPQRYSPTFKKQEDYDDEGYYDMSRGPSSRGIDTSNNDPYAAAPTYSTVPRDYYSSYSKGGASETVRTIEVSPTTNGNAAGGGWMMEQAGEVRRSRASSRSGGGKYYSSGTGRYIY